MTSIRIGCDLPFFASPSEIRDFAQAAQDLGYDSLGFSEHVAATRDTPLPRGFSFEDPWHESMTLAAFLAGVTSRIELTTGMMLLPLRPTVLAVLTNILEAQRQIGFGRVEFVVAGGGGSMSHETVLRAIKLMGRELIPPCTPPKLPTDLRLDIHDDNLNNNARGSFL